MIFQYYHYNKCLFNWRYIHAIGSKKNPLFLVVKEGDKVLMIAPLMKSFKVSYSLFGRMQDSDTTDFIYRNDCGEEYHTSSFTMI